jgi:hypothetical protein
VGRLKPGEKPKVADDDSVNSLLKKVNNGKNRGGDVDQLVRPGTLQLPKKLGNEEDDEHGDDDAGLGGKATNPCRGCNRYRTWRNSNH